MAQDRFPAAAQAKIVWHDPDQDFNTILTPGWCQDHDVGDVRTTDDPETPIPPSTLWWMQTPFVNRDWVYVPALRGSILRPKLYAVDFDAVFVPCDRFWRETTATWVNIDNEADVQEMVLALHTTPGLTSATVPMQMVYERTGKNMALYSPPTTYLGEGESVWPEEMIFRTKDMWAPKVSFALGYQLAAPDMPPGYEAPTYGIEVFFGCLPAAPAGTDRTGEDIPPLPKQVLGKMVPTYSLMLPRAENKDDPESRFWTLYKYQLIDGFLYRYPIARHTALYGAGSIPDEGTPEIPDIVLFLSTPLGLLITTSNSDSGWLLKSEDFSGIPAGYVGVRVFGTRGWVTSFNIGYPTQADFIGTKSALTPDLTQEGYYHVSYRVDPSWTFVGDQLVRLNIPSTVPLTPSGNTYVEDPEGTGYNLSTEPSPLSPDGTMTAGQLAFRLKNPRPTDQTGVEDDNLYSPILFTVTEIHPTQYLSDVSEATTLGATTDLAGYVQNMQVNYEETGRGYTATLQITHDVQVVEPEEEGKPDLLVPGHLADTLKGIGRVTLAVRHIGPVTMEGTGSGVGFDAVNTFGENSSAEPWEVPDMTPYTDLLHGYVLDFSVDTSDIIPKLTIRLGDVTHLWSGGRSSMELLPQPEGWYAKEWFRVVLHQHHFPNDEDIIFPEGLKYSDTVLAADGETTETFVIEDIPIPREPDGSPLFIDKSAGVADALDAVCHLLNWAWKIRPDGKIEFIKQVEKRLLTPKFSLNEKSLSPYDMVLNPSTQDVSVLDSSSHVLVIGKDRFGSEYRQLDIDRESTDVDRRQDYPYWSGRRQLRIVHDTAHTDTAMMAKRARMEERKKAQEFTWKGPGRNLWPGDVVVCEFSSPTVKIPSGTKFVLLSKSTTVESEGDDMGWFDTFKCRLLDPDEDVEAYRG